MVKLKLPSKQCFHNRTWKYFCEEIVVRASSSSWQLFDSLLSNAPCRGASFLLLRCILSFPPVVGIAALLQPDKTKAHTQKLVDSFTSTSFKIFIFQFVNLYQCLLEHLLSVRSRRSRDSKISEAFSKEAKAVRKQTRCPAAMSGQAFRVEKLLW